MEFFIGLVIGLVVGAVGMFFIYKNNKKKFEEAADIAEKSIDNLKKELQKKMEEKKEEK